MGPLSSFEVAAPEVDLQNAVLLHRTTQGAISEADSTRGFTATPPNRRPLVAVQLAPVEAAETQLCRRCNAFPGL
jgi:hypothetical protein